MVIETSVRVAPSTSQSVTVSLKPTPAVWQLLQQIADGNKQGRTARLTIAGARPPADRDVGLRVFVNDATATVDTPPKGKHYVGSLTFFPRMKKPKPQSFLLDLSPTIEQLGKAGEFRTDKPLQIRLVVVPDESDPTIKVSVEIEKLTLEVVD